MHYKCGDTYIATCLHCKHPSPSLQLAQTVVDAGAIAHLAQLVGSKDAKLKRQLFSALSQVAKHTVELAEMVVEAEIFPSVLSSLKGAPTLQYNDTHVKYTYYTYVPMHTYIYDHLCVCMCIQYVRMYVCMHICMLCVRIYCTYVQLTLSIKGTYVTCHIRT